jgi:hypothetical protein
MEAVLERIDERTARLEATEQQRKGGWVIIALVASAISPGPLSSFNISGSNNRGGRRNAAIGTDQVIDDPRAATPEGRDGGARDQQVGHRQVWPGLVSLCHHIGWPIHATLPDTMKGAHVGGRNTGNVGVCYVGGVDKVGKPKDTRTAEQRAALRELVQRYQHRHPGIDRAAASRAG